MRRFETKAYAKLNLTLDISGRRPDGYHLLDMVMIQCSLYDSLVLELDTGAPWVLDAGTDVPAGPDNLVWRAAEAFFDATGCTCDGLAIHLQKEIPSGAGLGGGSSDAAVVLRTLNAAYHQPMTLPELYTLGARIGADVPYCIAGGACRVGGIGEILTPIAPMPKCWIVLAKPTVSFPTPELFRAADALPDLPHPSGAAMAEALAQGDLETIASRLGNSFLPVAVERAPILQKMLSMFQSGGALGQTMTGSGSCVFGLFDNEATAKRCCAAFQSDGIWAKCTIPISS